MAASGFYILKRRIETEVAWAIFTGGVRILQQGIPCRKKKSQFKYTQYASASTLFFMYITIYKQNVK